MKKVALSLFVVAASAGYVWSQSGGQSPLGALSSQSDDQAGAIARPMPASAAAPTVALEPVPFVGGSLQSSEDEPGPATPLATEPPPEPPPLPAPPALTETPALAEVPPAPSIPPAPPESPVVAQETPSPSAPVAPAPTSVDIPLPRLRPAFGDRPARELLAPAPISVASNTYADGTYTGPIVDAHYGLVQIQAIVQDGRLVAIKVLRYPSDRRVSVRINRQALPMLRDEVISAQSAEVDIVSGATLTSEGFIRSLDGALSQARS